MIPAIPTEGPMGVHFRSRLEARWAQFFTLCGWPWQYEPDLDFSGWIPDFTITSGGGLCVEVKPAISMAGLMPHRERIEKSKAVVQVWLVGGALSFTKDHVIGWHGFSGMGTHWEWRPTYFENIRALIDQREPRDFQTAQRLWIAAGNELQWRKR